MSKYHINDKGVPGVCHAGEGENPRGCKFGDDASHYATRDEAQAAYEKSMENEAVPSLAKVKRSRITKKEGAFVERLQTLLKSYPAEEIEKEAKAFDARGYELFSSTRYEESMPAMRNKSLIAAGGALLRYLDRSRQLGPDYSREKIVRHFNTLNPRMSPADFQREATAFFDALEGTLKAEATDRRATAVVKESARRLDEKLANHLAARQSITDSNYVKSQLFASADASSYNSKVASFVREYGQLSEANSSSSMGINNPKLSYKTKTTPDYDSVRFIGWRGTNKDAFAFYMNELPFRVAKDAEGNWSEPVPLGDRFIRNYEPKI